ncbi:calcium/sodium antiporter [Rubellimicrobium sp. CFH 75288]|uniref:calcium/sodium antiporter n=1 Tax=Rubellimicrobium sp. CFH 75288 TaxID=2697034 RepID=UPI001412E7E3|nr:calcium/sodium antiporter [Rubellimicrobium sp. CFH 75288]NAZ36888.1 calcium/sodium antiporter [Rubellimicrobium sp. CFH 75288]
MSGLALALVALAGGLVVLVLSADRFVIAAAGLSRALGVPPLLVGILVVGFGTSAPEITVSVLAALDGAPALALGNAWGSNVANIGLILGITALIAPIMVASEAVRREIPLLVGATALTVALSWNLHLGRIEGSLLALALLLTIGWQVASSMGQVDAIAEELPPGTEAMSATRAGLLTVLWLVVLVLASRALVWGAVGVARSIGLSELVIGLTVVAVGTSLPELASSIGAARRGAHDLAFGNIVGSNLFNTLAVVGIATVVQPFDLPPEAFSRDLVVMVAFTIVLTIVALPLIRGRPARINRWEGSVLLAGFVAYTAWLVASAI